MAHTDQDQFSVVYKDDVDGKAIPVGGRVPESFMAADIAEQFLLSHGTPGQSFVEIRFNGDDDPHTFLFLLEKEQIGVWNTDQATWPIYYPPSDQWGDVMLDGIPWEELENKLNRGEADIDMDEGRHKSDDEAEKMKLDGQDDETDEEDSESDSDADEGEDGSEDTDDAEEPENSSEEPTDDDDDFTPDEDGDEKGETEGGDTDDDSDQEDETEEAEMPRLKLFAKMRGPKGWRKRAELEELEERNVFALKVGVLDDDEDKTPAQREQNVFAHVEIIERDDTRDKAILRLRLPDSVSLEDFSVTKAGVIVAEIPYPRES